MLTVDPLLLLTALAFLMPWRWVGQELRCLFYKVRLVVAVWRMQRRHGSTLLVHTGTVDRHTTCRLARLVRQAPVDRPLVLVIDTNGGEMPSARQLLRCLAQHAGVVVVRVPDECWSAGTVIACGADRIIMGPDANLGATDVISYTDPSELRCGPALLAKSESTDVAMVRAAQLQWSTTHVLARALERRGRDRSDAWRLACELTSNPDRDHSDPIFADEAQAIGLSVTVDHDGAWFRLVQLSAWSQYRPQK